MLLETPQVKEFKQKLSEFPRERLLEIIEEQNPSYIFDINRIEWVFRNKLSHLNDNHGNPITSRDLTNQELAKLIDPPFMFSKEMMKNGFGEDMQRQIHIASDPILWSKNILNATPRVYQALVLREQNDNVVLRWGRRLGKALDIETDIPTPSGWKKMADLQDGDQVFDENGQICNVTAVTDFQHDHDCYKVTFSDGSFLYADAEHEWGVHDQADRVAITNGQPRPLQHVTTEEMSKNILGPYSTTRTEHNYSVPLTKAVQYPTKELKLHPWVYGYMVGNGYPSSNNVKILPKDVEEISAKFLEYGYQVNNVKANKYQIVGLEPSSFEPYVIRKEYMFGSVEQRTHLLTGLCDAKATTTTDYVEFQTGSKEFVDQIDELVCSLGGEVRRREKVNRVKGVDYGTSHRAFWLANFPCFSLERKIPQRPSKGAKQLIRMITSIEKVESRPVKCITVDSRSRLYLAGKQFIPTHNSYVLSMYILWYSFVHEKARTLVLAPAKTQVGLIYDQILELSELSPIVSDAIVKSPRSPQYEIYLSNGSIIRLFTTGFRSGQKCLSPDHDVLTKNRGWVPIAEVERGEIVASWDEGQLIWAKAEAVWSYYYEGKMLDHKSRALCFNATPHHRWKIISKGGGSRRTLKSTYWMDSQEIINKEVLIPAAGEPMAPESNNYSKEELELWGWWLSEGAGYMGPLTRFSQCQEIGKRRLVELADHLGFRCLEYEKEIRIEWKPPIYSGDNAYNKFIPRELMLEENRHSLLEGLIYGDGGYRGEGWRYSSSSKQLIDDIQELAFLGGYRVYLNKNKLHYKPVGGGEPHDHWSLSAYPYKSWTARPKADEFVDYKGMVHCLTVPETGTFIARRHGRSAVFVTGNSDNTRGQEADMIVLDEMDYMGSEDLVALMAMLQKTNPDKAFNKKLIGASTPTGQRTTYWRWNTDPEEGFSAFWFPSLVNPLWDKEEENRARRRYRNEQHYRHEIEADWGEDAEGVYPRKYVDIAFRARKISQYDVFKPDHDKCFYALGVDWDKHGAGVNVVIAEADKKDPGSSMVRIVYRSEIEKGEFTYIESIDEIIRLDTIFNFKHVYIDQGAGEVQAEMLHKYGLDNPHTKLHTKTKACHFSNTIELRDPYTRQIEKKRLKPFMVENLVFHLEQQRVAFQEDDDELYLQLISYIKIRETESGNPVFAPGGDTVDHAHDALLLALFAFTENYDPLFKGIYKDGPKSISNEFFINTNNFDSNKKEEQTDEEPDNKGMRLVASTRPASFTRSKTKRNSSGSIKRPMF